MSLEGKNDCYSYAIRLLNQLNYNNSYNHDLIKLAQTILEPKLNEFKILSMIWNDLKKKKFIITRA